MNERPSSISMADTARLLLDGQRRLAALRKSFASGLQFAVDNDVVMAFANPLPKHAERVQSLLRDEDGFTIKDQELSLAERVADHVIFNSLQDSGSKVYSLPGHHNELWGSLAGGIHARLIAELKAGGSNSEIAKKIILFRDNFYHATLTGDHKPTIEQLIAAVPNQMQGWLGIGPASMEWDRLKYIKLEKALQSFPKEVIDQPQLQGSERTAFISSLRDSRNKWHKRLMDARDEWISSGGVSSDRDMSNIMADAVALAYWEYLNQKLYRPPHQRLVLITMSDRIYRAVHDVSASELGGDKNEPAANYLLHPFDFLDECHLNLSGGLHSKNNEEDSGRLSSALDMLATEKSSASNENAEEEFGVVWGKFLRTSVLERVKKINRTHSTHLRRVAFVFSRVGISAETTAGNPLVAKLAETGSEMLSEATDIRIESLSPLHFTRGAPLLRLDKHPWAQQIQTKPPGEYCELLTDPNSRRKIIAEAGNHRYTIHLLQARAMIWAGDWRTALRLAEFSLAVRDKLPKPSGPNIGPSILDIDGREAEFLAAICERHAHGESDHSLNSALTRASRHLNNFLDLAINAQLSGAFSEFDLNIHQLRAESEFRAIETTKLLLEIFQPTRDPDDNRSIPDLVFVDFFARTGQLKSKIHSAFNASEGDFLRYMCARLLQQVWCNELQARLFGTNGTNYSFHGKPGDLGQMWTDHTNIKSMLHESATAVPSSWFVDTLEYILGTMLGHSTRHRRDDVINNLTATEHGPFIFPYDKQRNARLLEIVKTARPL